MRRPAGVPGLLAGAGAGHRDVELDFGPALRVGGGLRQHLQCGGIGRGIRGKNSLLQTGQPRPGTGQPKFALAILYLEDFSSNDILIQARAYSLMGDAHMELKEYSDAATFYHKASNHKPNKFFTPTYLMKEALAYELLQQNDKAIAAYDRIITEFWDSTEVQNAKKLKARLNNNS